MDFQKQEQTLGEGARGAKQVQTIFPGVAV